MSPLAKLPSSSHDCVPLQIKTRSITMLILPSMKAITIKSTRQKRVILTLGRYAFLDILPRVEMTKISKCCTADSSSFMSARFFPFSGVFLISESTDCVSERDWSILCLCNSVSFIASSCGLNSRTNQALDCRPFGRVQLGVGLIPNQYNPLGPALLHLATADRPLR